MHYHFVDAAFLPLYLISTTEKFLVGKVPRFTKKAAVSKTLRLANLVTGVTFRRLLSYMSMASKADLFRPAAVSERNRMQQCQIQLIANRSPPAVSFISAKRDH
jgi:hypothetical protein